MDLRPIEQHGFWRIGSLLTAAKYCTRFGRWLDGKDYWMDTPYGIFHCPDRASAYQFVGRWEPAVKAEVGKLRGGLFVDGGANIGFYSVMAAKQGCKVIAIEPNIKAYDCLTDNAAANGVGISTWPCALSNHNSKALLAISNHSDRSILNMTRGYQVMTHTLDYILQGKQPELIKLDIEGSEPAALEGFTGRCDKIIFEALTEAKAKDCFKKIPNYGIRRLDRTNYLAEAR